MGAHQVSPLPVLLEHARVPHHHQQGLRPGDRDVEPFRVVEEAHSGSVLAGSWGLLQLPSTPHTHALRAMRELVVLHCALEKLT